MELLIRFTDDFLMSFYDKDAQNVLDEIYKSQSNRFLLTDIIEISDGAEFALNLKEIKTLKLMKGGK